jgi:hypothetical protein
MGMAIFNSTSSFVKPGFAGAAEKGMQMAVELGQK